jgi:purine-binding chemotaxis protein CheW
MTIEPTARAGEAGVTPQTTTDAAVQFVVCVVADERYGIEVGRVREIIRLPPITALPGADRSFSGVVNLRGRVIPVMDLRQRFGLPAVPATRLSRIVVADVDGAQVGLVVDAVNEVARIAQSAIEPTPTLTAGPAAEHLTGIARVDDGLIIVLDLEHLLATPPADPAVAAEPGAAA